MKKKLFKIFVLTLALTLLALPLLSCEDSVTSKEAKATIGDFFKKLEKDDYAGIVTLMHPDKTATEDWIKVNLQKIEADEKLDFSQGIKDIKYTGFETSVYDSDYKGSKYELSGTAKAGEIKFEFEITVVRNNDGNDYGIYEIDIDIEDLD